MTDEERYPPPYEGESLARFRREQLGARQSIRDGGLEFHRHYAGSTACLPSRTTLFTGQYPSLHGGTNTDGMAKKANDPAMGWLDPNSVPTLGDWFRAGGYETHYRGKWHMSHADLLIPGTHEGLMASDEAGRPIPDAVAAYKGADRLDPYGFSGWIGREPHGAAKADCGAVRDGVFAEQVVELFGELAAARRDGPWLAVASFVNPHDIAFNGWAWENLLGYPPVDDDTLPAIPEAPSQADSFAGPARLPGGVRQGVARHALRAVDRRGLPPALLLPAQAGGPGHRPHPRVAGAVGHGRGHRGRVHLRPRRPGGRPRRPDAEVVQRLRRGHPRPAPGARARRRGDARRRAHADQPRRPAADAARPGGHRRRAGRGHRRGRARRDPAAAGPGPQPGAAGIA